MIIEQNKATSKEIINFVSQFSGEFNPNFVEQVGHLEQYIDKIKRHGTVFGVRCDDALVALMFVYYNLEMKQIYVPYICVDPAQRGRGLAKQLIDFLKRNDEYDFLRLEVSKDNSAFQFYLKQGFAIENDHGDKYLMCYHILSTL